MRHTLTLLLTLLCLNSFAQKPNIILILADDLGYGDLSCYGQKKFKTPNIDALAVKGIRFTNAYAGTSVCAPSRSALMTGLHTGHTPIRGNLAYKPEGQHPMPDSVKILPEIFKNNGYATGVFGKWGLGYPGSEGDPVKRGVDEFFGYNCQTLAHNYYPYYLWHNAEKVMLPGNEGKGTAVYAPQLIHQKTLEFIDAHKDQPFLLMVTSIIPHAEVAVPDSFMALHRYQPEIPYRGVHPDSADFKKTGKYAWQKTPRAGYAGMVTYLDNQVGEIMRKLKELGIDQNTLVIFTSDNGPSIEGGEDPAYFNSTAGLRGHKRDLYEGGIREPFIANWPVKISPKGVNDQPIAFWDLLPTFAEIAGVQLPQPVDGVSVLPALLNKPQVAQHEYFYWEFHEQGGSQAVRKGNWKAVRRNVALMPNGEIELYDLGTDVREQKNLAKIHPEIVREMAAIMRAAHVPNPIFNFKPVKSARD